MTRLAVVLGVLAACSPGSSPAPAPDPWVGLWAGQAQSGNVAVVFPVVLSLQADGPGSYSGMLSVELGSLVVDLEVTGLRATQGRLEISGGSPLQVEMVLDLGPPGAAQGLYVLRLEGQEVDFGVLDIGRQR